MRKNVTYATIDINIYDATYVRSDPLPYDALQLYTREVVNISYDIVLNSAITFLAVAIYILMIDSVELFPG